MRRRILMLGGSHFQIPPIRYAKSQGHYVITCDYLPGNPGHAFADEYHNVSTTDMDAVLSLAKRVGIDGIVAYASDPSAPTAAYVGNALGLPSNPYESVLTLARKDLYRTFLQQHDFRCPRNQTFSDSSRAAVALGGFALPVLVKPVDSSGSKGVTVVQGPEELAGAFELALSFSRAKAGIIEEYVRMAGFQIAGDGFLVDGRLAFRCFANEHFDRLCNPLVPVGESFPSVLPRAVQDRVHTEVQRLMGALGMRTGALNFDIRLGDDGGVYLMEVGPRNGGNLIPEVTRYATGVDMVRYTVDAALGLDCTDLHLQPTNGCYASYIVHALTDGVVRTVWRSDEIKPCIVEENLFVKPGDAVKRFDGSHCTLGTMILRFEHSDQMLEYMDAMEHHVKVLV